MKDKTKIIALEIAVITLFLVLAFTPRMYPDEGTYLNYGNAWRTGNLIPGTEIPVVHRPIFVSALAITSTLPLSLARLIILPFIMGSIFIIYLTGKELDIPGETMALSVFLSPIYLSYLGTALPDYMVFFFILLAIYAFIKNTNNRGNWSYLMGISTALAILTKESSALLIPLFLVFYKEFEVKKFLLSSLGPVALYVALLGRGFFSFLTYSLEYSYPIALPSLGSFLSMMALGLGFLIPIALIGAKYVEWNTPTKLSVVYLIVMMGGTLLVASTWVARYSILFLPGLLLFTGKGLEKMCEKKHLAIITAVLLILTGWFMYYRVTNAREDWGLSKYRAGIETISEYEEGKIYMQINDEQVRWLTRSNRFKKLPRTYEQLKEDTGCEEVPVFLWKFRGTISLEPPYWEEKISKTTLEETKEGKMLLVNCID